MRMIRRSVLAVAAVAAFLPATPALAIPRCTYHDRLVQKINGAYHTQFKTSCTAPLNQPVEIIDP